MLTREEIKSELLQRGVSPQMLVMPAVMERMYEVLKTLTVEEMKKKMDSFLQVEPNGSFKMDKNSFSKASFSIGEDGTAVVSGFPYDDSIIHVNKEGIEFAYEDGDWMGRFSQYSRKNGRIEVGSGNNGTGSLSTTTYLDTGSWSILSQGAKIDGLTVIDEKTAIDGFDTESAKVMQEYPGTSTWYEKARAELVEAVQENNDPEQRIKRLSQENEKLKAEKKDLLRRNGELTSRLSVTLDFIKAAKRIPGVSFLLRKQIEKLDGKDQALPAGRDDR